MGTTYEKQKMEGEKHLYQNGEQKMACLLKCIVSNLRLYKRCSFVNFQRKENEMIEPCLKKLSHACFMSNLVLFIGIKSLCLF